MLGVLFLLFDDPKEVLKVHQSISVKPGTRFITIIITVVIITVLRLFRVLIISNPISHFANALVFATRYCVGSKITK